MFTIPIRPHYCERCNVGLFVPHFVVSGIVQVVLRLSVFGFADRFIHLKIYFVEHIHRKRIAVNFVQFSYCIIFNLRLDLYRLVLFCLLCYKAVCLFTNKCFGALLFIVKKAKPFIISEKVQKIEILSSFQL